jgi:glycosyltransferase involved in cell wall biosynthesis
MRICIAGGIFGRSEAYRAVHRHTPETTLVDGLRARGHSVDAVGHGEFVPSERYDVIHVHHLGRAAYLMAATPIRTPFIFTGHDAKMLCGFERNPLRREAFRTVAHRCAVAVALSHAEADFIQEFARPPRVEVIANGVPAAEYEAADLDGPPVRSGILFAGQLIPMKGVDTLLRAMKLLDGWSRLRLTLAYHNAQLERPLRALADELGIARCVRFAGPQAPEQLAALYRVSEVFVLPSRAESLPTVITEALLAGTPVVATNIGGVREQIGRFGSLVAPGDPEVLAAAISRWLVAPPTPAARHAMREHARTRFSPAAMVEAHVKLYESAAGHARARRRGRTIDAALRAAIWAYWDVGKRALRRTSPAEPC